jgi:hypothetical protein
MNQKDADEIRRVINRVALIALAKVRGIPGGIDPIAFETGSDEEVRNAAGELSKRRIVARETFNAERRIPEREAAALAYYSIRALRDLAISLCDPFSKGLTEQDRDLLDRARVDGERSIEISREIAERKRSAECKRDATIGIVGVFPPAARRAKTIAEVLADTLDPTRGDPNAGRVARALGTTPEEIIAWCMAGHVPTLATVALVVSAIAAQRKVTAEDFAILLGLDPEALSPAAR